MKVFVVIIAANDAIKAGLSCLVVQYKHNAHCSSLKTSNGIYGRDNQVRKYVYVYYFLICGLHCHQKQVVVPVFIHRLCYQSALSRRNPPHDGENWAFLFCNSRKRLGVGWVGFTWRRRTLCQLTHVCNVKRESRGWNTEEGESGGWVH